METYQQEGRLDRRARCAAALYGRGEGHRERPVAEKRLIRRPASRVPCCEAGLSGSFVCASGEKKFIDGPASRHLLGGQTMDCHRIWHSSLRSEAEEQIRYRIRVGSRDDGVLEGMRELTWLNIEDFNKAVSIARKFYPEPGTSSEEFVARPAQNVRIFQDINWKHSSNNT